MCLGSQKNRENEQQVVKIKRNIVKTHFLNTPSHTIFLANFALRRLRFKFASKIAKNLIFLMRKSEIDSVSGPEYYSFHSHFDPATQIPPHPTWKDPGYFSCFFLYFLLLFLSISLFTWLFLIFDFSFQFSYMADAKNANL